MAPFDSFRQDTRVAIRVLAKSPGATALSIISIALGIGLTVGMFSVGDAVFLRPMPFHEPSQLLKIASLGDDGRVLLFGWPDYLDMAQAGRDIAEFAAFQHRGGMMGESDEPERVVADSVTSNYFSLLGARAMIGQASVEKAGGRPQMVLGYRLWQRMFGGDPGVTGRSVRFSGKVFEISGVMPQEFPGLVRGVATDVWLNNDAWFNVLGVHADETSRNGQFEMVARLSPGIGAPRAAAQLDAAIRGPGKHKPAPPGAGGTVLEAPFAPNWTASVIYGGGLLLALALVLFVACANVAQMRLAQAESRKKEIGVRLALGAGTWRVTRQLLVETGVLTIAGAGLGVLLAQSLMKTAAQFLAAGTDEIDYGIRLDYRALGFTMLAALLAVFFSGLAPACHAVKLNVAEVIKSEQGVSGRRGGWQNRLLVVWQVAVSVALLGVALMFLSSLRHAMNVRPGIDPQKKMFVMAVGHGRRIDTATWAEQACERLSAVPGVRGATFARRLPLSDSGGGLTARVELPGRTPISVHENDISGNYFAVMGTRVLAGRGIDTNDRAGTTLVAVVSQTFARQLYPGKNPLSEWIKIAGKMRQIVGIAEDGPSNDLHESPEPFLFLPYSQAPGSGDITLMAETAGEPLAMAQTLRKELKSFDSGSVVYASQSLRQQMDRALSQDLVMASAAGGLGIFGVILTAAGLFGVLQYSVNRRARELGLRLALGARPAAIQRMVLSESVRVAAWGIPIGLILLACAGWAVRSWLLGVTPLNPIMYVSSAAGVLVSTLLAAWVPARRATRVDPMAALRAE